MNAFRTLACAFACLFAAAPHPAHAAPVTDIVDAFIGTTGAGRTSPGAGQPFGTVAPGPVGADGDGTRIFGFANRGSGEVLLQPTLGSPWSAATTDFAAARDPASELAHPGYYAVSLPDHGVRVELTATPQVALQRFVFRAPGKVQVLVEIRHAGADAHVDTAGTVSSGSPLAVLIRFDHRITASERLPESVDRRSTRYLLTFDIRPGRTLEARIASSAKDADGARQSFDSVRAQADRAWVALLGRVHIEAPLRQQRLFYTALYHVLSTPYLRGVSRASLPLIALLAPERVDGILAALLDADAAEDRLPLLATALDDGFGGAGRQATLAAMMHSAAAARDADEPVARTLELAWADDAVARAAHALDNADAEKYFAARALGYRALFDAGTGALRARLASGAWRTPFEPTAAACVLTLAAGLFDPSGLIASLGGPTRAGVWLDRCMATADADGRLERYLMAQEPGHHVPWMYEWTDRPWKGQELVARIAQDLYTDAPDGLPGDDAAGQASAWYVFATLGFYPVVPASGDYVLGVPLAGAASIAVAGGRTLRIRTDGFAARLPWARSVALDGRGLDPRALPYALLARGGTLRITLAAVPQPAAAR